MAKIDVKLTVNGVRVRAPAEPRTLLIDFLRAQLGLTGPQRGCDSGHCGACTVDLDGRSVKACNLFAIQADGARVLTVEGLVGENGDLHVIQEMFRTHHGLQCGFCTAGMIIRAYRLLADNPTPSAAEISDGMSGNLCRCAGSQNIVKAVQAAAEELVARRRADLDADLRRDASVAAAHEDDLTAAPPHISEPRVSQQSGSQPSGSQTGGSQPRNTPAGAEADRLEAAK